MKAIHNFKTQSEALQYFLGVLIGACNRGWTDGSVDAAFRASIGGDVSHCLKSYFGLVASPIIAFYGAVVRHGDSSMQTDFSAELTPAPKKGGEVITGTATWHGSWTQGRTIRITFAPDGGAVMTYDLGQRDGLPIAASSFLDLPREGDREIDDEEFTRLTATAAAKVA